MDLVSAIGLISSFVTLEEAGRSWILIIKDKIKRKEIDINNWDSDDPLVQVCLDRFKTDMGDKYKDHIFSKEEIQDIIRGFFEQNRELRIGNEEKKQMTQIIEDILYAYNEYAKSLMSSGERTLHNTLSSDFSKIMDKLGMIEEQPRKENIKKFLRAIEISKEIELENIEELINGEYEIDRSEIIETIQAGREKLVSIQGNAGSGKSVVCKKLLKGKEYVLVTRAENLSTGKKVNELWDCDVEDAILWLENKPLYIFIDAIEFIADCGDNAFPLLQEIYRLADKYSNVYIITSCSLPQKMSEDEVHLKEIMQIPGVKALFEKHGYATSFVPNEFILTPPMFNNIYKGALGEVVGKYILEQYAGVTLQEMPPEFFELFDYTLGNGVYVDFKLWKETMLISAEEEKKNVLEKLDKCGGKRAVIINIMLDRNMQITSSDSGRIIEIPYLYRLDRKEIGTEIIAKINREGYLQ